MPSPTSPAPEARRILVWWILWIAILNGLVMIRLFLGGSRADADAAPVLMAVPVGALFASAVFRFVLLPRQTDRAKALPFFIVGLALAEGAGLTGIVLTGARADVFVGLGLAMLACHAPIFIKLRTPAAATNPLRD